MPYPYPFLPITLFAIVATLVVPKCQHLLEQWMNRNEDERKNVSQSSTEALLVYDPFSANPSPQPLGDAQKEVRIKAKYIYVGSGTEELGFDWIVEPTRQSADGVTGETESAKTPDGLRSRVPH
jgi:hypothetical protein